MTVDPRFRTRSRRSIPWVATLVATGALVLAACGSNSPSAGPTTTSASTTTTTTSSSTTSTTAAASATTTTSGAAQNLAATAAVKSSLTAAYVAHNGLPANEVAGTAPGSVYYAFEPSTNTYWAIASFVPTSGASQQTQVAMQDDGCCGVFTQPSGGSWKFQASFLGEPCPGQVPADLETLWHLTYPGDCPSTTTTTS